MNENKHIHAFVRTVSDVSECVVLSQSILDYGGVVVSIIRHEKGDSWYIFANIPVHVYNNFDVIMAQLDEHFNLKLKESKY